MAARHPDTTELPDAPRPPSPACPKSSKCWLTASCSPAQRLLASAGRAVGGYNQGGFPPTGERLKDRVVLLAPPGGVDGRALAVAAPGRRQARSGPESLCRPPD